MPFIFLVSRQKASTYIPELVEEPGRSPSDEGALLEVLLQLGELVHGVVGEVLQDEEDELVGVPVEGVAEGDLDVHPLGVEVCL